MKTLGRIAGLALLACSTWASAAAYDGLYIFGDSLSDAGNNALVIGADPGQVITGNTYIPSRPYASGQYTNGNVWARSFADGLGLGAYGMPSLAGGGNFAFGGARTRVDGANAGFPPSVRTQVKGFLDGMGGTISADALYVVASGGNDARDALEAIAGGAPLGATLLNTAISYANSTHRIVDRLQAVLHRGVVVRVADRAQRHHAVQHRRLDAAPAAATDDNALAGGFGEQRVGLHADQEGQRTGRLGEGGRSAQGGAGRKELAAIEGHRVSMC